MGKFSKIKKYSKPSQEINEKIENLYKELEKTGALFETPTNNTTTIYTVQPEYIDVTTTTVEQDPILNFEQEDNPTDTTGIFDQYGNSLVEDPPGTWAPSQLFEGPPGSQDDFGLGPMVSYYDSGSNTTNLGYIRSGDRSMINLGRITGTMESWNGSNNFTSYGYLTLAQAQWFKDKVTSGKTTDYRVFYSGITDPNDPNGRVNAKVVSTPKPLGSVNKMAASTFDNPFPSTTPINITFYRYDYGVPITDREVIFYDSDIGNAPTDNVYLGTPVDSYTFTVPGPALLRSLRSSLRSSSPSSFMVGNVGLKWSYPSGEPDGDLTGSYPEDYLNFSMVINGKSYPLPGLGGIRAAIGIPGYSKGWQKPPINSKNGKLVGSYDTKTKVPAKHGGFDPNLVPGSALPKKKKDQDSYLNALGRGIRSVTDPIRYSGTKMYQGNPAGRTPGLSPYWSPDPRTAGTYSRGGALKGIPGASPSSSGTLSSAERISDLKVGRSVLGQPQFVLPRGVTAGEITTQQATRLATDAAAAEARTGSKLLGRAVPILSIGLAVADAGIRISQGDYAGAALSGLSAIPGPLGWTALGVQVGYDLYRSTKKEDVDLTKEKQIQIARKAIKKNNIDINPSAYIRNLIVLLNAENLTKKENEIIQKMIFNEKIKKEEEKIFFSAIDKLNKKYKNRKTKQIDVSQYKPQGQTISESRRKRILRDIKKPYVLPEIPKEKYKIKPRVVGANLMKQAEVPSSFKPMEDKMWGKYEKYQNSIASQERKNQVLDLVGTSDHAWEWMTEKIHSNSKNVMYGNFDIKKHMGIESDKVKGKIVRIEQTKDNDALFYFQDSESGKTTVMKQSEFDGILNEKKQETKQDDYTDSLYRKVLKKSRYNFDYSNRPSKNGYPDTPPPEMVNGWHPEYGQKDAYYNKLDPQSANTMPQTGNPQIDANVKRAKALKKVLGKKD